MSPPLDVIISQVPILVTVSHMASSWFLGFHASVLPVLPIGRCFQHRNRFKRRSLLKASPSKQPPFLCSCTACSEPLGYCMRMYLCVHACVCVRGCVCASEPQQTKFLWKCPISFVLSFRSEHSGQQVLRAYSSS